MYKELLLEISIDALLENNIGDEFFSKVFNEITYLTEEDSKSIIEATHHHLPHPETIDERRRKRNIGKGLAIGTGGALGLALLKNAHDKRVGRKTATKVAKKLVGKFDKATGLKKFSAGWKLAKHGLRYGKYIK